MSTGAPSPDSRQVCSPSASESRFSSWWIRVLSRTARSWAASRSALQRRSGDRVIVVHIGDWICLQRMDFLQQVAVTVEECAVDSGGARDSGRTDRVARGGGLVEDRQHALAAAPRVVVAAVEHRPGLSVRGRGHALASEEGVVGGAGGVTVSTGMPSGTVWAAR